MAYTADDFVTMLLTMSLLPNREEYSRPYTTQEFRRLEERVRKSRYRGLGDMVGVDISGLMYELDITEEEGYRIYTLLNRSVQLSYALEKFLNRDIEILTVYTDEYPERLKRRLRDAAPPCVYRGGNYDLIGVPAVAVLGIGGVKTGNELREGVTALVRKAIDHGYAVITGGEPGVSRVAASAALEYGGKLIEVVGGGMMEHMDCELISELLRENRVALLSTEHPESMFTVPHAITRNKTIFALADAAFICNTDNKRGESDSLQNHYCDWVYAWSGYPANHTLISKGATPVADFGNFDFSEKCAYWNGSQTEQMNMFDLF